MSQTSLAQTFLRLVEIVAELRVKCPWDRKQTKESLRHLTIEETYELADAILEGDYEDIKEELGDLMMHFVFYGQLANEKGAFSLEEAIQSQIDKLIRRHPHVYGDLAGATEEEVKKNWEQIKAQEKAEKAKRGKLKPASTLDGVPESMPPLVKAQRMQEKASLVGFDWDNKEQVWAKVKEELAEFEQADNAQDREEEMGDLLFSIVNYCRFAGINADDALSKTNRKFKQRFEYLEGKAREQEKGLEDMSLMEMEAYWQEAKGQ